jgi:hypothetical protein
MNPLSPDRMTPAERRSALCAILAAGLLRLRAREAGPAAPPAPDDGRTAMMPMPGGSAPSPDLSCLPTNRSGPSESDYTSRWIHADMTP